MENDFYVRQTDLANPQNLKMAISLVGAGGIGSWVCLALTKMGCSNISVWDFDIVEEHNLGAQFYDLGDLNEKKVHALARRLETLTQVKIEPFPYRVNNNLGFSDIVISAVDNMGTRKNIFDTLKSHWLIDGRMAGNEIAIFTIPNTTEGRKLYADTLFTDAEADHTPCSSRSVMYNTLMIGGLIADIVATISRGEIPPFEIIVDLKNYKMYS